MFPSGRVFSSLVTRLTLAVLALLLLSLSLTTAVFVVQSRSNDQATTQRALKGSSFAVRSLVLRSLYNPVPKRPLARAGTLPAGVDRVLLTSFSTGAVVGDTDAGGAASAAKPHLSDPGLASIDGVEYAYLALPLPELPDSVSADAPPYGNIIALARIRPRLLDRLVRNLALAGAVAVLVSSLVAIGLLRAMTRPLHAMTRATESMAAGDYDQRVSGGGSSDEIGQLARSFNRMAYEVEHARELQRQFVANVSHDLRSPLTSIIGFSQALTEDDATTPWQRRTAGIINDEAQRLHRLTLDLLDLSRLEAGRLPLAVAPLDLRTLLRDIAARYHALPQKRDVRFVDELGAGEADEPLPLRGDRDRLTQVVVNLLDNALKFANPGGEVRLRAARQGGVALVEVYNTGAGIAPEDLPRVFDRFYRGDHSRAQRTGGSGIGLAIVRELVEAHGGEIVASSDGATWAVMTLRLPLATPDAGGGFTKDLHDANTATTRLLV